MAPKTRKRVHVGVELDVDVRVTREEMQKYVTLAFKLARIEVPQWHKLSTTTSVEMLSFKEVS